MSDAIGRRDILKFFGVGGAALLADPVAGLLGSAKPAEAARLPFVPVRLPHPLPVYLGERSYLGTQVGAGVVLPASTGTRLTTFTLVDDIVVPPGYDRYVIARWGDRVFPDPDDYVGYNCDYTGFVPVAGRDGAVRNPSGDAGYLWINHEYVSYPASTLTPGIPTPPPATSAPSSASSATTGSSASPPRASRPGKCCPLPTAPPAAR